MALKLKALRGIGISVNQNPDVFCRETTDEEASEMLQGIKHDTVNFSTWEQGDVKDNSGKVFRKMRIVQKEQERVSLSGKLCKISKNSVCIWNVSKHNIKRSGILRKTCLPVT